MRRRFDLSWKAGGARAATILLVVLSFAAAPAVEPLRLADVLDLPTFADRQPVDLSPDGRLAAVALVRPSDAAAQEPLNDYFMASGASDQTLGARLHLIDVETRVARTLTPAGSIGWGPAWSPSGALLAHYSDEDGTAGLWIWERASEHRRRVADATVRPDFGFEAPRWCGGDDRLLVKLLPEDLTLEQLDRLLPRGGTPGPTAAPAESGPTVTLLASDPGLLGAGDAAEPDTGSEAAGVSWTHKYLSDLALVDLATGSVTRLARRARVLAFSCSPDGGHALYTDMRWLEDGGGGRTAYTLHVVDVATGVDTALAPDGLDDYGLNVSWSPDGKRLAWIDHAGALVVTDTTSPGWRAEAARIAHPDVSFRNDYRPPLWTADSERIHLLAGDAVWEADVEARTLSTRGGIPGVRIAAIVGDVEAGRSGEREDGSLLLVVRDPETLAIGVARLGRDGSSELLWTAPAAPGGDFPYALDVAGGRVVLVAQTAARPPELWAWDVGDGEPRLASDLHADIGRLQLGDSRLVEWRSAEDAALRGTVLLPPGPVPAGGHPTVVYVYPEQRGDAYLNRFGLLGSGAYNLHLLATRGLAVFLPSAPFPDGRPIDGIADAVLSGVDRLVELGITDAGRVGVTGYSGGGYATLGMLVRSDRWAAAIAEQGYGNLFGDYLHMRPDGSAVGVGRVEGYFLRMGGTPWDPDMLPAYLEQSPLFALDRVTAPVLLIHGDADRTVPIELSQETFVALRRLGKPVALATYRGEGHGVGGWRRANLEDYWERITAWWTRWLRPTEGAS